MVLSCVFHENTHNLRFASPSRNFIYKTGHHRTVDIMFLYTFPTATAGLVLFALLASAAALGPEPVHLGTAEDFTILAKSGVTTVPPSVIVGNVGVSPIAQTALTGFSLVEVCPVGWRSDKQVWTYKYICKHVHIQLHETVYRNEELGRSGVGRNRAEACK